MRHQPISDEDARRAADDAAVAARRAESDAAAARKRAEGDAAADAARQRVRDAFGEQSHHWRPHRIDRES